MGCLRKILTGNKELKNDKVKPGLKFERQLQFICSCLLFHIKRLFWYNKVKTNTEHSVFIKLQGIYFVTTQKLLKLRLKNHDTIFKTQPLFKKYIQVISTFYNAGFYFSLYRFG